MYMGVEPQPDVRRITKVFTNSSYSASSREYGSGILKVIVSTADILDGSLIATKAILGDLIQSLSDLQTKH